MPLSDWLLTTVLLRAKRTLNACPKQTPTCMYENGPGVTTYTLT